MNPWVKLGETTVPGDDGVMQLYQRAFEFSISVNNDELMNSRMHGSEDALSEMTCERLGNRPNLSLLIGGLGMGFTLAAALKQVGPDDQVTVAELVPAVVEWNKTYLADLAGRPLDDPRAVVKVSDVAKVIKESDGGYDAILLDVDNGPDALTHTGNDKLYTSAGLNIAKRALKPNGILAIWSAEPDKEFTNRLKKVGFKTEEVTVRARKNKGRRHTLWFAEKR